MVIEVCDEAVGVVILGLIEGRKEGEVIPVTVILVPHVITHTVRGRGGMIGKSRIANIMTLKETSLNKTEKSCYYHVCIYMYVCMCSFMRDCFQCYDVMCMHAVMKWESIHLYL